MDPISRVLASTEVGCEGAADAQSTVVREACSAGVAAVAASPEGLDSPRQLQLRQASSTRSTEEEGKDLTTKEDGENKEEDREVTQKEENIENHNTEILPQSCIPDE
uniref:Uncharacterized protein n=1 Tax=Vespula pensylvanica TaxID=30213 RepID=A0A834NRN3_VESPE|nr:hypothetical protein H0235_011213 [Vespula pensylvanica]